MTSMFRFIGYSQLRSTFFLSNIKEILITMKLNTDLSLDDLLDRINIAFDAVELHLHYISNLLLFFLNNIKQKSNTT
jgi:hypothetical protein